MAPRLTRGAAAREAALLTQDDVGMDMPMDINNQPLQLSSPPPTPVKRGAKRGLAAWTATPKRITRNKAPTDYYLGSSPPSTPVALEKKRKWEVTGEDEGVNGLQLNFGGLEPAASTAGDGTEQEVKKEGPAKQYGTEQEVKDETPSKKRHGWNGAKIVNDGNVLPRRLRTVVPSTKIEDSVAEQEFWQPKTKYRAPKTRQPRARKSAIVAEDPNQLPHNLGSVAQNSAQEELAVPASHGQKPTINPEVEQALKALLDDVGLEPGGVEEKDGLATLEVDHEKSATAKELPEGDGSEKLRLPKKTRAPRKTKNPKESLDGEGNEKLRLPKKTRASRKTRAPEKEPAPKKEKVPRNKYGLTPGYSPFPNHEHPTPEECQEVHDVLTKADGEKARPKVIPKPSLTVTGCGEVPSVVDAMIRTTMSASTTKDNAEKALAGLLEAFGVTDVGIGKGSVDYEKIRIADVKDIEAAIRRGGLQVTKSKSIKACLQKAFEEGILRRDKLIAELKAFRQECANGLSGLEVEAQTMKDAEMVEAVREELENPVSLQYVHELSNNDSMDVLSGFPGIGVKTAACILLFSLSRDCFAVDTHVSKFSKMLGWVPQNASRDRVFSHLEVKVPAELKYPLHQLFIWHGRNCPKCRAQTEATANQHGDCPLDPLVTRTYKIQKRAAGKKDPKEDGDDEDDDENDNEDEPDLSEDKDKVGQDISEEVDGEGQAVDGEGGAVDGEEGPEEDGEIDDDEADAAVDAVDGELELGEGENAEDVDEAED